MTDPVLEVPGGSAADTVPANAAGNDPVLNVPGQGTEPGKDGQANKPASAAPEKYDLKLPEGFEIDKERMGAFEGWARQNNLTNDAFNSVFNLYMAERDAMLKASDTSFNQMIDTWLTEAQNDAQIGGAQWNETKTLANKAVSVFGDKAVREAFDASGLGNNPSVLRMLRKIGAALKEDKSHQGTTPNAGSTKTAAERMFPNQNKS